MKIIYYSDDDIEDLSIFQEAISGTGYMAVAFFNGQELVETLKDSPKKPHIIILDLFMPLANGDEILRRIRTMPEYDNIPIVMMTASISKERLQKYLDDGANYFINKLPSLPHFREKLATALKMKWENYTPKADDFSDLWQGRG